MQEILNQLPLFEETDLCFRMAGWQEGIHRQLTEMQGPLHLREPCQRALGENIAREAPLLCSVATARLLDAERHSKFNALASGRESYCFYP